MNPEKLKFRKFKITDYDLLISIWEVSGLLYKPQGRDSRENIEREIRNKNTDFIFCESAGKTVGAVLITSDGRKGWINRLAVIPEFRRKGIARKLIKEAERILARQNLGIITCLIEADNLVSRNIFRELDYVEHKEIIYFAKRLYPDV
jgi:N-acetylglutamate synthase